MDLLIYGIIGVTIILLLLILKQYFLMWIILDRIGLKRLKYLLPIIEVVLLVFIDSLFLLPSVTVFLILIYKGRVFEDEIFQSHYLIDRKKFSITIKGLWMSIAFIPLIYFVLEVGFNDLLRVIKIQPIDFFPHGSDLKLEDSRNMIPLFIVFGQTCVIAPIVEEFTFRVLIYRNWLQQQVNKQIIALFLSSLIFALSHFDLNVFVYVFVMGLLLGLTYDFLGYFPAVLLHMMINFITLMGAWSLFEHPLLVWSYTFLILMLIILKRTNKKTTNKAKL